MIKRAAAIFFILLANIILLAHAVIPHQHNNGIPSFVIFHHAHHDDSHNHTTGQHHEDQDKDDDDDSLGCILKRAFLTPSDSFKYVYKGVEHSGESTNLHAILFNSERLSIAVHLVFTLNPPPDIKSYYSDFVNQGYGLRAPPVA